ncbi:MAG: beta-ketoacyl-[acyl-carrier-protein] synthase family protein [Candidatus Omnitrophica bacterium]|nr:beta-ketoacyl-[acyl-carrier-protein] synthase family protein [Candidatus Omnitrophota bacterium]
MDNRVVITGLGVVNCCGNSVNDFWDALISKKDCISEVKEFKEFNFSTTKAGQISGLDVSGFNQKELKDMDKFSLFALKATEEALKSSNIDLKNISSNRVGVIMGSGMGGMMFYEDQIASFLVNNGNAGSVNPNAVQKITPNALSGKIAIKYKLNGPNLTICTACSSSSNAIGIAYEKIISGQADVIISGGSEAPLMPVNYSSFDNMRVLSRNNICKPFDEARDGFIMGEGAAVLIIESLSHAKKRGAEIYAEISGYTNNCSAYHMVISDKTGIHEEAAIRGALSSSRLDVSDIDFISAHGTGTYVNDLCEGNAINRVFKKNADSIMVASIKGSTGHLIGASGGTEVISSVLAIRNSVIPPTKNLDKVDKDIELNISNEPKHANLSHVLCDSFGFGGNNSVIILKKYKG